MKNQKYLFALFFLPLLCATTAWSSIPAYLLLEGFSQGNITGDSKVKGFENAIIVLGYKFAAEIPIDQASSLPTGRRKYNPITIIKKIDDASPLLLQAFATSEKMRKFELTFIHIDDNGKAENFYRIILQNAMIVGIEDTMLNAVESAFSAYPLMEEITITFEKITVSHLPSNREAIDNVLRNE
jgi:type VI secretion system secreted protein Hcp